MFESKYVTARVSLTVFAFRICPRLIVFCGVSLSPLGSVLKKLINLISNFFITGNFDHFRGAGKYNNDLVPTSIATGLSGNKNKQQIQLDLTTAWSWVWLLSNVARKYTFKGMFGIVYGVHMCIVSECARGSVCISSGCMPCWNKYVSF